MSKLSDELEEDADYETIKSMAVYANATVVHAFTCVECYETRKFVDSDPITAATELFADNWRMVEGKGPLCGSCCDCAEDDDED